VARTDRMIEVLVDWVAEHARHRGGDIAVVDLDTGESRTWGQLEDRVARLAHVLAQRYGVGRGDRVALIAENGVRVFEVQFACMRLGAVLVPLNWRLTVPELAELVSDADVSVLVHDASWSAVAGELRGYLRTDQTLGWGHSTADQSTGNEYDAAIETATGEVNGGELDPDAVTHLLYTSGTTGQPKGVLCTNRTLLTQAQNLAHRSRMAERGAHHLNIVPLFHAGGLNVFTNPMLYWGGRVSTVRRFEPATTLRLLTDPELAVTHLCGVLQNFEWLTDLEAFPGVDFPTLHTVLFGGWGPSAARIYRAWAGQGIWVQLSYGASELGPNVSVLAGGDPGAADRGTSGTPLPHVRIRLVDAEGVDVAPGGVGEIWVAGPGVTPGYWRTPRETVFVDGWFRTGDAGRLDEAGHLHVVGRVVERYRTGGENVYPAEVEAQLAGAPGVAELAVLGVPDPKWGETGLVALVPSGTVAPTLEDLRAFAEGRLARFKLPTRLLVLDALPRSTTEKISRARIREIYQKRLAEAAPPAGAGLER